MNVDPGDDRPVVQLSTHLADNVDAVMLALARDTDIYQRKLRRLVHVVGTKATDTGLFLEALHRFARCKPLRCVSDSRVSCASRSTTRRRRGGSVLFRAKLVVQALLARGDYPGIRPLVGIIEAPSDAP